MAAEPKYRVVTNGKAFKVQRWEFDQRDGGYYADIGSYSDATTAWNAYDSLMEQERSKVWVVATRPMSHPDWRR